ncbi:MAG: hypothetical protein EPN79_11750 [Burkholderiaceae bacterium]|nr:MAG: hypothetical protein EPN79_11750 [Burkholderiaceae bacterium]TBR76669.1 MAG: hypothetical protein EPN64_05315 [Burkholderiaceae bacterium]
MRYTKAAAAQTALKDRSLALSVRQRSIFIVLDGTRTIEDLRGCGFDVPQGDIDRLLELGLISQVAEPILASLHETVYAGSGEGPQRTRSPATEWQRFNTAYPVAVRLTARLGLSGFRLNLAVEATCDVQQLEGLIGQVRATVGAKEFAELELALAA